eukprot:SAG31_NODE_603_length_13622_cov_19.019953_4_plen_90_part_00
MFMSSGIHVRYLKVVEKSNYQATKWIRYLTKSGQYEHRLADARDLDARAQMDGMSMPMGGADHAMASSESGFAAGSGGVSAGMGAGGAF